jgi:hypothetical protein
MPPLQIERVKMKMKTDRTEIYRVMNRKGIVGQLGDSG